MKDFFKSLFASILGCFIVLGLLFFSIIIGIASMALTSSTSYEVKENTVFKISLDGVMSDRANVNPMDKLLSGDKSNDLSLDDMIWGIKKAKENSDIKGIYLDAGMLYAGRASMTEIRNELISFKESGKFIVAYGDIYTQQAYHLSSVADKIVLNPEGMINLVGYASTPTFYKGLLKKIGVDMQIFKVGTFKSAVEPYIETKMSDANREQVTSFLTDLWKTTVNDIAESRKLTAEDLNLVVDSMPMLQKRDFYIRHNLIDSVLYETQMLEYIQSLVGVSKKEDMKFASVDNLSNVPYKGVSKAKDRIAVLYAEGTIYDGDSKFDIYSKYYIQELKKLKDNDDVKAVVLRVNSPGGSAYASEQIWRAVMDLKAVKPVVVSMGDVAASGGYYISAGASKIIAQPNTLTGSIGIFGMVPIFAELSDKLGVTHDVVKTNKFADFGDLSRQMSVEEKALMQTRIENGYDLFLTRCSEGRNIPKDSLDLIAQGRVWSGNQALEIGLVDAIGGIDLAIEEAAKLANLTDYKRWFLPEKVDFFQELLMNYKEQLTVNTFKEQLGANYKYLEMLKEIQQQDVIQARLPYEYETVMK